MLCSPGKDGDLLFLQKCGKMIKIVKFSSLVNSRSGRFLGCLFLVFASLTFYEPIVHISSLCKCIVCPFLLRKVLHRASRKIQSLNIFWNSIIPEWKRTQGLATSYGNTSKFINNIHEPQNKICIREIRLLALKCGWVCAKNCMPVKPLNFYRNHFQVMMQL